MMYRHSRTVALRCLHIAALVLALPGTTEADTGFEIYGALNLGVLIQDDGAETESFFVDNTTIPSRLGLRYTTADTDIGYFRYSFEIGLPQDSTSFAVNQSFSPDFLDVEFERTDIRLFQLEWSTPSVGTFTVGQGWMSTFLVGASDLSGTNNIAAANMPINNGGGRVIRTSDGDLTRIRFSDGIGRLFGSRRLRLRYDSPSLNGVTITGSIGREVLIEDDDQTYADVAVRYASSDLVSGFDVAADLGYSGASDSADYINSSAAILHRQTGLNLQVAAGGYDDGSDYIDVKVGAFRDFLGFGEDFRTAFAAQYFRGRGFGVESSVIEYSSVSAVQYLGPDLQFYATYALQDYEDNNDSYQDGSSSFIGLRYQF
ncbi:MAG: porin [Pseudomonadota bacterium]